MSHFAFLAHAPACRHVTRGMVQSAYPASMVQSASANFSPACIGACVHKHATACYTIDAYALQNTWISPPIAC
eukprot:6192403-Pleurochrysis_carterae.AAC.1